VLGREDCQVANSRSTGPQQQNTVAMQCDAPYFPLTLTTDRDDEICAKSVAISLFQFHFFVNKRVLFDVCRIAIADNMVAYVSVYCDAVDMFIHSLYYLVFHTYTGGVARAC